MQSKFGKWQNLPRNNAEKKGLQAELEDDCQSLEYMVAEIDKSIDAAERNPQRFNLSQQELSDRRKWVMATRRQLGAPTSGLAGGANGSAAATAALRNGLRAFADSHLKTVKPSGHTVRLSDYDVHISGATAWATFTQEELDANGTVLKRGREVRILEREAGGWKLVFLGLHTMK